MRELLGAAWPVQPAGAITDRLDADAVVLRKNSPDPNRGCDLVLGYADDAPGKVGRLLDAAGRIDVDAVMAKRPRRVHRQRYERRSLPQADDVGRQRKLGRVELAVARHPEERLLDRQVQVRQ